MDDLDAASVDFLERASLSAPSRSVAKIQPVEDENVLDRVVRKSLVTIEEVLDIPLCDPSDPIYMKLLAAKKDCAVSIVNAGLKADENRFRRENRDVVEKLFERISREQPSLVSSGQRVELLIEPIEVLH